MENRNSMKPPASKIALITPSASPPSSRSFFPQPYRIPDNPSPTKRPRLSSVSRQLHRSSSSSSLSLDHPIDFHQAREASTMRMLDIWSGLAERYSRPLDQDDIIDITTGEVVKDRGVIRASRNWAVGCFSNATVENDEDEDEDEDDVDELDSFASQVSCSLNAEIDGRKVPPVREMDPADAEDLRHFLEAEQRRKDICGSDPEETECSESESQDDHTYAEGSQYSSVYDEAIEPTPPQRDVSLGSDILHTEPQVLENEPMPHQSVIAPVFVDSGSDDELANWDMDEASAIYHLPHQGDKSDSDSDVESVDSPLDPKSQLPLRFPLRPKPNTSVPTSSKPKSLSIQHQLQTPPRSQTSSSIPSFTPCDDFIELPPESSSPQASSPLSSHYDSSPTKPARLTRSTSHKFNSPFSPIPRLDLSKIAQGGLLKSSSRALDDRGLEPLKLTPLSEPKKSLGKYSEPSAPLEKAKKVQRMPRSQVEVVIEQRSSSRAPQAPCPQPNIRCQVKAREAPKAAIKRRAMTKGKEKEVSNNQQQQSVQDVLQNDDPVTLSSSPRVPKSRMHHQKTRGSPITPLNTGAQLEHPVLSVGKQKYDQVLPRSTSVGKKKRKRVVSSSKSNPQTRDVGNKGRDALHQVQKGSGERSVSVSSESSSIRSTGGSRVKEKLKRNSASWRKSTLSEDNSGSDHTSQEDIHEKAHHLSRAPSFFSSLPPADQPYHLYPQAPYIPHPTNYPTVTDSRAQYIISQAMHQLSSLVGGPWMPPASGSHGSMPYPPPYYQHYYYGDGSNNTSTHPAPHAYDLNIPMSATSQMSLPIAESSKSEGNISRKSMEKAQSRTRKVSFKLGGSPKNISSTSKQEHERGRSRETSLHHGTGSGSSKSRNRDEGVYRKEVSDSDSEAEVEVLNRGRSLTRGRTPGPPLRTRTSNSHLDTGKIPDVVKTRRHPVSKAKG